MVLGHEGAGRLRPRPFVESAPWRFAKTSHMPHEYLVEGKAPDEEGFWAFVAYIAEHGFEAYWRQYRNTYLELDGWRYWAMPGRGNTSITIVNRERPPGQPSGGPSRCRSGCGRRRSARPRLTRCR
jgi:hypothetical protein